MLRIRKFPISLSKFLSLTSVLVANTDFNCSANCFNLSWSVFAIDLSFFLARIRTSFTQMGQSFLFSEFCKLKTLNSILDVCGPMALYLYLHFLLFLDKALRADLISRLLVLKKALLIFVFCFMRCWTDSKTLVFDFIVFFWKIFMNTHDRTSNNNGHIDDDVDRIKSWEEFGWRMYNS